MIGCSREDDIEELALGLLDGDRRDDALRHVDACASCRAAFEQLNAEYTLFARRAAALGPPPPLAPVAGLDRDGAASGLRTLAGALAFAATIAVVATHGRAEPPARSSFDVGSGTGEALACVLPASGAVASDEPLACGAVTSSSAEP